MLLQKKELWTLPLVIAGLKSSSPDTFDLGQIYMLMMISVIPVVIVYFIFSKAIIKTSLPALSKVRRSPFPQQKCQPAKVGILIIVIVFLGNLLSRSAFLNGPRDKGGMWGENGRVLNAVDEGFGSFGA
jgi:hypothetical protein